MRSDKTFDGNRKFSAFFAEQSIERVDGEEGPEIMGNAVKSAAVYDFGFVAPRSLIVVVNEPIDEFRLTGQVDVMGASVDTSFYQRFSVIQIGADGCDDDTCLGHHVTQAFRLADIAHNNAGVAVRGFLAKAVQGLFKLGETASGDGPTALSGVLALRQVFCGKTSGKAGGAKHHDIVGARALFLRGHADSLVCQRCVYFMDILRNCNGFSGRC